jgi:hypothetical protein
VEVAVQLFELTEEEAFEGDQDGLPGECALQSMSLRNLVAPGATRLAWADAVLAQMKSSIEHCP